MVEPTQLPPHVNAVQFLSRLVTASTMASVDGLLAGLPITPEGEYSFDEDHPERAWQQDRFHWMPVGGDRGNAGRIKLANFPVNPIAERLINGMEAIIELYHHREIVKFPDSPPPRSPRDAVKRYFGLPSLDMLPKLDSSEASQATRQAARDLARKLRIRLLWDKASREFAVAVEDEGIGQPPALVHRSLLSLGSTTKADKPYLIGVFGQGGSSAYAVSNLSWVVSRRAKDCLDDQEDGVGWTVIRHIFPKGRRDDYFAYLAAHPDGHVPSISADDADSAGLSHGTRFAHVAYNFGKGGSSVAQQMFRALNHVLYNPVMPFELHTSDLPDVVYGNAFRLSNLGKTRKSICPAVDKLFPPQAVGV